MRLKQQNQDGRQSPGVTQTYRKQECRVKTDVPLCADDDWVSRCPSGCRLQGVMSQMDSEVDRRLWEVCKTAKMYEDAAEEAMMATARVYNSNRRVLVGRYMSELKFVERAERLSGNLTLLWKRSSSLSQQLKELSSKIQKQVEDLYRAEVDIDMKLRACHGSCQSVLPSGVDHSGYQTLQADVDQRGKSTVPPADIPHVKLHHVDVGPVPCAEYRTIPTVRKELLTQFEDIGQHGFSLEESAGSVESE